LLLNLSFSLDLLTVRWLRSFASGFLKRRAPDKSARINTCLPLLSMDWDARLILLAMIRLLPPAWTYVLLTMCNEQLSLWRGTRSSRSLVVPQGQDFSTHLAPLLQFWLDMYVAMPT